MKPNRDAVALAASLTSAANTPLPLPKPHHIAETSNSSPLETQEAPMKAASKMRRGADKAQITLRPDRSLLDDYTFEAAERTKIERRVVSAQEIMLEVLERGRPRVAQ